MKNIEGMTILEAKKEMKESLERYNALSSLFHGCELKDPVKRESDLVQHGFCVVVLDRGFIYIGDLVINGDFIEIREARCLRHWSSGKGLEWHVVNGREMTTLDSLEGGVVNSHVDKMILFMKSDKSKWK